MRSKHTHSRSLHAFSLIELSIVLAVFAVVAVGVFSSREVGQEEVQVTSVDDTLDQVEQALAFYLKHYGYLPCPASRTESIDSANYGVSVSCAAATATAAPAGTENIGANTDEYQLRVGMIPTRTLGIPDKYALDAWGNRLTYAMIRTLGVDKATYDAYAPTQASDYFQVVDKTGAVLYGNNNTELISYVILSHGSDGKGAYGKGGVQTIACPTGIGDTENCNTTKQFIVDVVNQTDTGTQYFNDYVRWKQIEDDLAGGSLVPSVGIKTLTVADTHTCIINSTGKLQCSGEDSQEQLGNGALGNRTSFTDEGNGFNDWISIAGDYGGGCGIRNNGRAYCWGLNTSGQLGDATNTSRNIPTEVNGSHTDWTHIVKADSYACGIRNGGRAYCWGAGGNGNLGDGLSTTTNTPIEVSGGATDWVMLSVGETDATTCGLRASGRIYCWGKNTEGNVGDGTNTDRSVPTEVAGSHTDWKMIFKGYRGTCGIRGTGVAYCWGNDDNGQIGTGVNTAGSNTPVAINTPHTDFVTVRTNGVNYACAVRANGDLYCWGQNGFGQFGDCGTSWAIVGPTLINGVSVRTN
jgi:prepilin-type N-terminal cleavage/methylation domain-containing protein